MPPCSPPTNDRCWVVNTPGSANWTGGRAVKRHWMERVQAVRTIRSDAPSSSCFLVGAPILCEVPILPAFPLPMEPMMFLKIFRHLMPHDDTFVSSFSAQAAKSVEAALVFRAVLAEPTNAEAHHAKLSCIEREADEINRGTIRSIHRVFITPFDRSDILALTNALDDIIDLMKSSARRILLYKVEVRPQMLTMADCIVQACEQLREGIPLLRDITGNVDGLTTMYEAVDGIESEADRALRDGLAEIFSGEGSEATSAGEKLMVQLVYEGIEEVVDRCEDVGDLVQAILIEQV
jgi:predicted phosphate transport protein (TIGR00153 family)